MLRKILTLLLCGCASATLSIAQQDSKTTENANIDYKLEGSPMPTLLMREYHDTTRADQAAATNNKKAKKRSKKSPPADAGTDLYTTTTGKDLDNDKPLFVMLFNPTCSHCEDMTMMMTNNIESFGKSKIVLLATKPMAYYLPDFAQRHHIAKYPNMHIGYDSTNFVDNMFLYQSLPQINVYGRDRKLLKTFKGEVPVDTLVKFVEK